MNYPFWEVPWLGSSSVIAIIAIFHVMISQFAVGGGLFLPIAERKALREGRSGEKSAWLEQLKRHSRFFLLITGVFGTVSGVGIWFAIGLTQPEATSTLIHNFVFGWAIEWVFFLVELTCIAVYYYTWDRIPEKLHLTVGWVYAVSSICTLVIINGILTFMLTPGDTWLAVAGTGREASKFWNAFFNPTYWPSLLMRTLVCITLAGIWALISSARIQQPALKASFLRWTTRWLVPAFVLMPLSLVWYLHMVPASQRALLSLGISTIGPGTFSQVTRLVLIMIITTATMVLVTYYLAYKNPKDFTVAHACAILFLALMATGSGEQAREMLRKPYVIGRHMYSNGTRVSEVASATRTATSSTPSGSIRTPASTGPWARPCTAVSAAPATPSPAIARSTSCSPAATATQSAACSPCCTSTNPTPPTASSCHPSPAHRPKSPPSATTSTTRNPTASQSLRPSPHPLPS